MVRLNAKNNSQTALTRDIGPSETSFTVEDPYSLPTPPFRMTIDEEIMEVGAKNDGTKTLSNVIRAQEGTAAQSHSSGSAVRCRFTAGMYDEIKQAVILHKADDASTTTKGHVQLSSSTSSTSTSLAATASAVKTVNDALTSHKEDNMPHLIKDITNNKTYRYGLQIKNGATQFIYEEVL